MTEMERQKQFVDDLKCIEEKLINILDGLQVADELDEAWYIVHERLQKEQLKEKKMKSEKLNHC